MRRPRSMDEATAVRVSQSDLDLVTLDSPECIEQVIHIEADLDLISLIRDFNLVFGLLLFRVMRLDHEQVRTRREANSTVFLVREDGRALQGMAQELAVRLDLAGRTRGDHTTVLRETTIDQLRSEANCADLGANVIRPDRQLDRPLRTQDPLQFQYALARHNDLLVGLGLVLERHFAQSETMPIRRHRAQRRTFGFQ